MSLQHQATAAQQRASHSNQAVSAQPAMMALGERLGHTLGNLRESNDRAADLLNRFCNEVPPAPQPLPSPGKPASIGPAEPAPGTLASLNMLADRLATEANRMESIAIKLRDIV